MIEKNVNIIKDPKIKRIVEYAEGDKQVNVLDSRFYRREGNYYPSVTSVLNYFPKNQFFHSWLKDVGHNSDIITQISIINAGINSLDIRVTALETAPVPVFTIPSFILGCDIGTIIPVLPAGSTQDID